MKRRGDAQADPPGRRWAGLVRTALWVAIISVLVWVYADLQFTVEERLTVTLQLSAPPTAILTGPRSQVVSFTVKGNRSAVAAFANDLGAHRQLPYDLKRLTGEHLAAGVYSQPTVEVLGAALGSVMGPRLASVAMVSADPALLTVPVAARRTIEAQVQPQYVNGTAETLEMTPPTVKVSLPASAPLTLPLRLTTEPLDLRDFTAGEAATRELRVRTAGLPEYAEVEPLQVRVRLVVREATQREQFPVKVALLTPANWPATTWNKYTLEVQQYEQWVRQVTVVGPQEDLGQLRARKNALTAYIVLTEEDFKEPLTESWLERPVQVVLPRDLKVRLDTEAPIDPVNFRPKHAAARPAGGGP